MEDIENNNNQKIDPVQVRQVEYVTSQNYDNAHKEERRRLNEARQTLKENDIDYDGQTYNNAKKESKKMTRSDFLKLLGAFALGSVSYMAVKTVSKPIIKTATSEFRLATAMQVTSDLIGDIIDMDPAFELNPNFNVEKNEKGKINIKSSDKKGYDDLKKYLMDYSKDESGKGLSSDQAIYAISLCGDTAGLYESYYNLSKTQFLERYFKGPGSEINVNSYMNYMQSGKSIQTGEMTGIAYADGIHNLEENIYNLNLQEESGKAL